MYEEFTQNRIARLESRKALSSLPGLFYICEYLQITLQEFFDENNDAPAQMKELIADLRKLDSAMLAKMAGLVSEIVERQY